jgi:hypothetical protein
VLLWWWHQGIVKQLKKTNFKDLYKKNCHFSLKQEKTNIFSSKQAKISNFPAKTSNFSLNQTKIVIFFSETSKISHFSSN